MSVKFETVKAGDLLYKAARDRWRGWENWTIRVISVDLNARTAVVSWNGNREHSVREHYFRNLRRTPRKNKAVPRV